MLPANHHMSSSYPHSMPTPPFSPKVHDTPPSYIEPPLKSTIHLLDSLVAFYQQERMWVYRTRASLEEAFQDLPPQSDSNASHPENKAHTLPSPSSSSSLSVPSGETESDSVKAEPPSTPPPMSPAQPPTRWLRRKKGFKLKLDGLAPRNRRTMAPRPVPQNHHSEEDSQPGVRILEMFENMMEARMESCQRINRLVRNANRADLHIR